MLNWLKNKLFPQTVETYANVEQILRSSGFGLPAISSIQVNETTALNLVAVIAAVRYLSEDIGTLPLPVYRYLPNGGRSKERNHPLYRVLNDSPDDIISSVQHREYQMRCLLTSGNSFDEIEFDRRGQLKYLHRLAPNSISIKMKPDGVPLYFVNGRTDPIPAERMLHIAGLGDGLVGLSPIRYGAQAISAGLMQDQFTSSFFANGAHGSGLISFPQAVQAKTREEYREAINHIHGGPDQFGKWLILDSGATATPFSVDPESAQLLATRLWTVQEIARLFRIPPAVLGDLSKGTLSNVEQQQLAYLQSLRPWLVRIEAQINRKLFSTAERETLYVEHNLDGMQRADLATRYNAYRTGRDGGWLSVNDIRQIENLDPIGEQGDIYLIPLNHQDAGAATDPSEKKPAEPEPKPEPAAEAQAKPDAYGIAIEAAKDCVADNVGRMVRREQEALRRAATKPEKFLDAIENFYATHNTIFARAMKPSVTALDALTEQNNNVNEIANQLCEQRKIQLLALAGEVSRIELPQAIEQFCKSLTDAEIIGRLAT